MDAAPPKRQTLQLVIVLGAIALIAAVVLARSAFPDLIIWQDAAPATRAPDLGTERGAWAICQTFVGRQLKAPATASYASLADSKVITNGASGVYAVTSSVDAQNSFGANLRTPYSCNVQYQGGGNWTLLSLKLDSP